MLYIIGFSLAFFLALLLVGKKGKSVADVVLAVWLAVIGIHVCLYYFFVTSDIRNYPWLIGVAVPFPIIHPPLLYLYVAALTRGHLPRFWFAHFLPALAVCLYMIPFMMLPVEKKIEVTLDPRDYAIFFIVMSVANVLSGVVYIFFSHRLLQRHRRAIAELLSYEENVNLRWLQIWIYGMLTIYVAVLLGSDPIIFGLSSVLVMTIGYFGIRQVGVFSNAPALDDARNSLESAHILPSNESIGDLLFEQDENDAPTRKKYEKSGLSKEGADELHRMLLKTMQEEELYKESELSLADLAARLNAHPNYLSQVINEREGKNFYDYINNLRIEAFLKKIAEPDSRRFTILALALDCGFNSKTAFNRYFKKATGRSPSAFLQSENTQPVN
ncbi:MAG: helix-turn-helix domain-containing protein [Saprospiraceae bacterium]|nr:helix-turn-helix domain-containing protein [Saprospiraceae bacterium]